MPETSHFRRICYKFEAKIGGSTKIGIARIRQVIREGFARGNARKTRWQLFCWHILFASLCVERGPKVIFRLTCIPMRGFLIAVCICAVCATFAFGDDVFVSNTGIDNLYCGNQTRPCRSLDFAISNRAHSGDSLLLLSDLVINNVVIANTRLIIQSALPSRTTLFCGSGTGLTGISVDLVRVHCMGWEIIINCFYINGTDFEGDCDAKLSIKFRQRRECRLEHTALGRLRVC